MNPTEIIVLVLGSLIGLINIGIISIFFAMWKDSNNNLKTLEKENAELKTKISSIEKELSLASKLTLETANFINNELVNKIKFETNMELKDIFTTVFSQNKNN